MLCRRILLNFLTKTKPSNNIRTFGRDRTSSWPRFDP